MVLTLVVMLVGVILSFKEWRKTEEKRKGVGKEEILFWVSLMLVLVLV